MKTLKSKPNLFCFCGERARWAFPHRSTPSLYFCSVECCDQVQKDDDDELEKIETEKEEERANEMLGV